MLTQLLHLTIASLLLHFGWCCSTWGRWGLQPSVCKLILNRLPVFNSLNALRHLPIYFHNVHLLSLLPLVILLIYTGTPLIDGSVKGQYIIIWLKTSFIRLKNWPSFLYCEGSINTDFNNNELNIVEILYIYIYLGESKVLKYYIYIYIYG